MFLNFREAGRRNHMEIKNRSWIKLPALLARRAGLCWHPGFGWKSPPFPWQWGWFLQARRSRRLCLSCSVSCSEKSKEPVRAEFMTLWQRSLPSDPVVRASALWPSAPRIFYSLWASFKPRDYSWLRWALGHAHNLCVQPAASVSFATIGCLGRDCQPSFSVFVVLSFLLLHPSRPIQLPLALQFLPTSSSFEG